MYTKLLGFQRELRKNMPSPERVLWWRIRNAQLGVKFRRQYAIEDRIFDFYAPQLKLAIEVDGESHFQKSEQRKVELSKDEYFFNKYGITTIRFLNPEVRFQTNDVLEEILRVIYSLTHPPS